MSAGSEEARKVGLLALFLHNELCCKTHTCGGAKDYMEAAERLHPKLAEHVFPTAAQGDVARWRQWIARQKVRPL